MDQLTQFFISLVRDLGVFGYWVALLAALAETTLLVGLLIPGSVFLFLMGVLSGQGYLDLGDLLFFAIVGATLGDNINYWLGAAYGERWLAQGRWFLKSEHMQRARDYFHRHGGKSVFLARFVPSVKELMPFIAGMAHMPRGRFMIWNLLGAVGWGLQWILPGYLFSQSLELAHIWLSRIGIIVFGLVLLLLVFYFLRWLLLRYGASGFQFSASVLRSVAVAVRENPDVRALSARHPRLAAFLKRRFDTSRAGGLPVTVAGLAMGYVVILFGGLVQDLLAREAVVAADGRLDGLLASFRLPFMNRVFYGITSLGNWQVILCGLLAATVLLLWRGRARFVVPLFVSVVTAQALTFLGSFAFHRDRPAGGLLEPSSYSFPSGHATVSIAFYGFLAFILAHSSSRWQSRVNISLAGILLALLIGFSRLYLGVHYLSDVLAGFLVGFLGLLIGVAMSYSGFGRLPFALRRPGPNRLLGPVFGGLALGLWAFLIVHQNFSPPESLTRSSADAVPKVVADPTRVIRHNGGAYATSVIGQRKAPLNILFLARDTRQLLSCLRQAGWFRARPIGWAAVVGAYFDVLQHRGDGRAPLSPWFWQDRPQTLGLVRPDNPRTVFDRQFLRIWKTETGLANGSLVFVAAIGHERLPAWHLVPTRDNQFDGPRQTLARQLVSSISGTRQQTLTFPSSVAPAGPQGLDYEGGLSVIDLRNSRCRQGSTD